MNIFGIISISLYTRDNPSPPNRAYMATTLTWHNVLQGKLGPYVWPECVLSLLIFKKVLAQGGGHLLPDPPPSAAARPRMSPEFEQLVGWQHWSVSAQIDDKFGCMGVPSNNCNFRIKSSRFFASILN